MLLAIILALVAAVVAFPSHAQAQDAPPPEAQTQPPAEEEKPEKDPLMPPRGVCGDDDDFEAHPRVQRLAMHCLVNQVRRRAKVGRIRSSTELRHSAVYKARRIAECKTFSHYPCGDKLAAPFEQAGVTRQGRWLVGENLAYDVGEKSTARRILAKWLRSPTHRAVLVDKRFTWMGVRKRRLRMRGAPVGSIIWVAHLGRPIRRA